MIAPRSVALEGFSFGPRHVALRGLVPVAAPVNGANATRFFVSLSAVTLMRAGVVHTSAMDSRVQTSTQTLATVATDTIETALTGVTVFDATIDKESLYTGMMAATRIAATVGANLHYVGLERATAFDAKLSPEHVDADLLPVTDAKATFEDP
jgi:hypothetical protein